MQIEFLFLHNERPVALIGHSQGCKFAQYFLHWAESNPAMGKAWIDTHIKMVVALGPPWTGAPKTARALISGDSMGLPTFILFGDEYVLSMGRTFSSPLWLLPQKHHEECVYINTAETPAAYNKTNWNKVLPLHHEVPPFNLLLPLQLLFISYFCVSS